MAKIALITYGLGQGGTERVCCHLAEGLRAEGDDVSILACTRKGAVVTPQLDVGTRLRFLTSRNWGHRQMQKMAAFAPYVRWLRAERPDVVLGTGNNISRFAALGFAASGIARHGSRLVIKTTNPVVRLKDRKRFHGLRLRAYHRAFRRASAVLTLCPQERDTLAGQFPDVADRFRHVFNPYLTEAFENCSSAGVLLGKAVAREGSPVIMLAVGRLHPQKNFGRMLRAFRLFLDGAPAADVRLRIAGDGSEREKLVALALELGLGERVQFLGYVADVPDQLAQADVLLLSSDYEGLPAAVVEALACDCPVITTDCFPAARPILEGLPGCKVVAGHDDQSLAAAMADWIGTAPPRAQLRQHALQYSTRSAVRSHRAAMIEEPSF